MASINYEGILQTMYADAFGAFEDIDNLSLELRNLYRNFLTEKFHPVEKKWRDLSEAESKFKSADSKNMWDKIRHNTIDFLDYKIKQNSFQESYFVLGKELLNLEILSHREVMRKNRMHGYSS